MERMRFRGEENVPGKGKGGAGEGKGGGRARVRRAPKPVFFSARKLRMPNDPVSRCSRSGEGGNYDREGLHAVPQGEPLTCRLSPLEAAVSGGISPTEFLSCGSPLAYRRYLTRISRKNLLGFPNSPGYLL